MKINQFFRKRRWLLSLLSLFLLSCFCLSSFVLPASALPDHGGTFRYAGLRLCPGGMPFGVKFMTDGVLITNVDTSAAAAGNLHPGDRVTAVNGKAVTSASELSDAVNAGGGKPVTITYMHGSDQKEVVLTPRYDQADGRYKTGLYVRDSGAGIGTVTFIRKNDRAFGGLGHGICDGESGKLIPMRRGTVTDVTVSGLTKGASGTPGEIKGYFGTGKTGTLLNNTDCGVFGVFTAPPAGFDGESVEVASRAELKEGDAIVRCTLGTDGVHAYTVRICAIRADATGSKCFTVKMTDPDLIARSGGIIQGMSGSPILQNGKLVGAVTHVLISDPTTGYGIFIENMLDHLPPALR